MQNCPTLGILALGYETACPPHPLSSEERTNQGGAGTHDALSDALVARDRVVRVQHLPDEVLLQDTGLWFSMYVFGSGYRISEINPLYKMSILEIRSSPVIALSASNTCPTRESLFWVPKILHLEPSLEA